MNSPPTTLGLLVGLNYVLAGLCVLVILLLGILLAIGVYSDIQSGADDTMLGVIGVVVMALPFLIGAPVFFSAGLGLSRRTPWGYGFHIAGAVLATLTCIGVIYTLFALIIALSADFRKRYPPIDIASVYD